MALCRLCTSGTPCDAPGEGCTSQPWVHTFPPTHVHVTLHDGGYTYQWSSTDPEGNVEVVDEGVMAAPTALSLVVIVGQLLDRILEVTNFVEVAESYRSAMANPRQWKLDQVSHTVEWAAEAHGKPFGVA